MCMLYKAIQGEPLAVSAAERRDEPVSSPEYRQRTPPQEKPEYTGPPTPCPAKVEYATPVFAKNYQGIWRYVVQIPYEGYFTQTIELTRCMYANLFLQLSSLMFIYYHDLKDLINFQAVAVPLFRRRMPFFAKMDESTCCRNLLSGHCSARKSKWQISRTSRANSC